MLTKKQMIKQIKEQLKSNPHATTDEICDLINFINGRDDLFVNKEEIEKLMKSVQREGGPHDDYLDMNIVERNDKSRIMIQRCLKCGLTRYLDEQSYKREYNRDME